MRVLPQSLHVAYQPQELGKRKQDLQVVSILAQVIRWCFFEFRSNTGSEHSAEINVRVVVEGKESRCKGKRV